MKDEELQGGSGSGSPPACGKVVPRLHIPNFELLRRIGKGSRGEVWLAKNLIGQFLVIKVVERRAFTNDAPFEREFARIKQFEPISRSHLGLINILHVGQNREAGYFYYVMEAADDLISRTSINVATYTPKNLSSLLDQNGLPVLFCLEIGLALTDALDYLHREGVVHGDIKCSSIFYVNGAPKLAVIDSANAGRDVTFLGTQGYVAPEGLGTPAADVYSLGKLLYEVSTGKDSQCFPKLPEIDPVAESYNALVKFHNVLLRACEPEPRRRYASAQEMRACLFEFFDVNAGLLGGRAGANDTTHLFVPSKLQTGTLGRESSSPQATPHGTGWLKRMIGRWRSGSERPVTAYFVRPFLGPPEMSRKERRFTGAIGRIKRLIRWPRSESQAQATPRGPSGFPAAPSHEIRTIDLVRFSAFLPAGIRTEKSFLIDTWVYSESQRQEVLELVRARREVVEGVVAGPVKVQRDDEITFCLVLPGFAIMQSQQTICWTGTPASVCFAVMAPRGIVAGRHSGWVEVTRRRFPVATLCFEVVVAEREVAVANEGKTDYVRSIFASYANEDRPEVVLWARGAKEAGVDVFLDVLELREGQDWEQELLQQVPSKDRFCLFWSEPASKSPWVEKEWRCALQKRGVDYIRPVPFADPRDVPPPPELAASKHFNDMLRILYDYECRRRSGS